MLDTPIRQRLQSSQEEFVNSLSHGLAVLVALWAAAHLMQTRDAVSPARFYGAGIFAVTMILMFLSSTLYHGLAEGPTRRLLLKLDHGAIYFFIAGSYTPFALASEPGATGWVSLGVVWALAVAGAALKVGGRVSAPGWSTGLYLAMGWLVLMAAIPIVRQASQQVTSLLVGGGVAYTVGAVFFLLDSRLRYGHAIWHGFVAAGTSCHYFAVLRLAT